MAYIIAAAVRERTLTDSIWIVFPDERSSVDFVETLKFWLDDAAIAHHFPADESDCFQGVSPARHLPQQRLVALQHLYSAGQSIVVSSVFGAMHRVYSEQMLSQSILTLKKDHCYEPKFILEWLSNTGYFNTHRLEEEGQFRSNGDTLHIWPIGSKQPFRLSFFDEEIEAIHSFENNHRSEHQTIVILPAREAVLLPTNRSRFSKLSFSFIRQQGYGRDLRRQILSNFENGIWFPGAEDYLPFLVELQTPNPKWLLIDSENCFSTLERWDKEIKNRWSLRKKEHRPLIDSSLRYSDRATLQALWTGTSHWSSQDQGEILFEVDSCGALQTPQHVLDPLLKRLRRWIHLEYVILFVASTSNRSMRLEHLLEENGLSSTTISSPNQAKPGDISICLGHIQEGFIDDEIRFAVLCIEYIFLLPKPITRHVPKALRDAVVSSLAELKPGDYVVHRDHGIGKFIGITQQTRQQIVYDCIQIEYANNASFFLPVHRIEHLYRYRAAGTASPRLDQIGSSSWQNRLKKAKEKAMMLADKLISQSALRALKKGFRYEGYPNILNDVSLAFPYQETPDQQSAIDDVLQDLASERPTNRLIVGDVGFGKTEVALRAAVRVIAEGHQVALLCPTTILALQHHRTFIERCTPFGIRVAVLSRLQTGTQKRKTFRLLQEGNIDIIVATHALFGKELRFKRLGLVIADEEHRFGVSQKKKLLALRQKMPEFPTEYLAMSATPIPRTLHMALSGLREVSVIATPPEGRRSIKTLCLRFTDEHLQRHISFELQRGGQLFFIHNNIDELDSYASRIRKLFPAAIVRTASGRCKRSELESTMLDFMEHRIHILVCTTIVENGVDLPNVNTILINNAHKMGLSQLYQLRGRVGRGKTQGHCVLFIPPSGLNKDALSRIDALKQFTALGSGFAIANADLEIRGSGDLLGKEQSGHITSVGLDTYIDVLQEAILELKPHADQHFVPDINIPVSAVIPTDYISDIESRLAAYRKLATVHSFADVQHILDEWERNFGTVPQPAMQSARLAEVRVWTRILGIERIDWLKTRVRFISHPSTPINWQHLQRLAAQDPKRFELREFKDDIWQFYARFTPQEESRPLVYFQWLFPLLEGCTAS